MVEYIFSLGNDYLEVLLPSAPFVYIAMIGIILALYTTIRRDLLTLTFTALSVLVVGVVASGRAVWEALYGNNYDWGLGAASLYYLIMGIITISLTALLAMGLRRLHRAWEVSND